MAEGKVAVLGGGAWGTALACVARRAGRSVSLWARDATVADAVNSGRANPAYLPDVPLEPGIEATTDLAVAARDAGVVLLVVPAQALRDVAAALAPSITANTPVAICAKGIERGTGRLMSEVLAEVCPNAAPAVLSGPTFAAEVARGLPAAVTLAAPDAAVRDAVIAAVGIPTFRPYTSDDIVGAQVGGAVKNVLAIAGGIVIGKGLGENARAAMITRGLIELIRYGKARGGARQTFMGLSGLGDLILTCSSMQSRNYSLGVAVGGGQGLEEVLAGRRSVTEGVATAAALEEERKNVRLDLPICSAVCRVLNESADIDATLQALLSRPLTDEFPG